MPFSIRFRFAEFYDRKLASLILTPALVLALTCFLQAAARPQTQPLPADPSAEPVETPELELAPSSGPNEPVPPADEPESAPVEEDESGLRTVSRSTLLVGSLTVFVLAIFVGFEVITKVPPTLHTPLMSGSNAISGITVVGAMLTAGHALGGFGSLLGMLAVILATVNVVGGFLVTRRMLMMFKKK